MSDDLISRAAAIAVADSSDYVWLSIEDAKKVTDEVVKGLKRLPSAQPEYYDYSDIDDVWEFYAEERDTNLTDGAKQLKDAMWVGYRKGKQDAQPEIIRCKDCKHRFIDGENVRFNVCKLNHNKVQADDWYCADAERRTDEAD